jgi:hypothetical protein
MVTWFICKMKPRFVLYKNENLGMYCKAIFGDLIIWSVPLICLQSVVKEFFLRHLGLIQPSFIACTLQT